MAESGFTADERELTDADALVNTKPPDRVFGGIVESFLQSADKTGLRREESDDSVARDGARAECFDRARSEVPNPVGTFYDW
jgi:hypothetical protein